MVEKESAQHPVLRWGALALGGLLWGAGVAAMYGDDYKLAHAFTLWESPLWLRIWPLSWANIAATRGRKEFVSL